MKKYKDSFETIMEKYGLLRTIVRERFPSKLRLSEDFIKVYREEFKRQTAPTITEDEQGNQTKGEGRNKQTVIREFQKAIKFLSKGL